MITTNITSWQREITTYIKVQASAPRINYSHIDMVRHRELLIERCSPEEMKETTTSAAAATLTTTATLGGSGPWPLLLPWRWCWSVDGSPAWGRNFHGAL